MFDWLFDFLGGGVIADPPDRHRPPAGRAYMGSRVQGRGGERGADRERPARRRGAEGAGLKVVRGQGVIVLPLINKVGRLHLSARQINVQLSDAVTKQGIKVAVQGVATVKIGSDEESIRAAAERFLEREDQIDLDRQERARGLAPLDRRHADRRGAQLRPREVPAGGPERRRSDLATSGLTIDNFTIQAIRDEVGYMDLIGQQETARRERDARMAKAQADQEAAVREAEAQQIKLNAQRDVSLRQAEVEALTAAAEAKAAQSGPLAAGGGDAGGRPRQTELAQLEADRKQKELIASTIRPAEADADAQVKRAEGDKLSRIAAAQADAERVKLAGQAEAAVQVTKGEANARVTEVNAEAIAKQTTLEGNAEAGIVLHQGRGRGQGARAARRGVPPVQRGRGHPDRPVDAAGDRPGGRRADGRIDQLTVLSNDGASELVEEHDADGHRGDRHREGPHRDRHPAAAQQRRRSCRRQAARARPRAQGRSSPAEPRGRRRRIRRRRPGRPGRWRAVERRLPAATPARGPPSRRPTRAPPPTTATAATAGEAAPPASSSTPEQRFEAAAKAIDAAESRATTPPKDALAGLSSALPPMATVSDLAPGDKRRIADAGLKAAGIDESTTLSDAAMRLASELAHVPGIERYGGTRLRDLERSGPRTLRVLWGAVRDELGTRYGDVTIGMLLDAYQRPEPPTAPQAARARARHPRTAACCRRPLAIGGLAEDRPGDLPRELARVGRDQDPVLGRLPVAPRRTTGR